MRRLELVTAGDPFPEPRSVYVPEAWITPVATIPLEGGVAAIVRFAERAWHQCVALQRADLHRDRKLAIAEEALRRVSHRSFSKDVAIALAAVVDARNQS